MLPASLRGVARLVVQPANLVRTTTELTIHFFCTDFHCPQRMNPNDLVNPTLLFFKHHHGVSIFLVSRHFLQQLFWKCGTDIKQPEISDPKNVKKLKWNGKCSVFKSSYHFYLLGNVLLKKKDILDPKLAAKRLYLSSFHCFHAEFW